MPDPTPDRAAPMLVHAPAKLNLGLYLGRARTDGLHELCSLFEPLALADLIRIEEADEDEVICPGVEEENLAARALAALREHGWDAPPLRIEIEKRTPVAAGLGGGSADAAAVLRLAARPPGCVRSSPHYVWGTANAPRGAIDLPAIAAELGADVPSQLRPALALVRGAGERVEPLPAPAEHAALLLPGGGGLSTKAVFDEADRLGLGRDEAELERIAAELRAAAGAGASPLAYTDLLVNDLEPAARSLRPDIGTALDALRRTDAGAVFLSGSGPTAVGLFPSLREAERAAAELDRGDSIICRAGPKAVAP
ncbi:MAG: 4-(cytidine 5'-diphospho)-2-C-methyl-D-erythritol kinase [Actinobacteria bacterium]|nr:4-(cytidine 5'-diphospho)-2-C-methyl-D-erythritol kinase [Actinomycetota bacterium]